MISWLTLERYQLGELSEQERQRVDEALHGSAELRECLQIIQTPRVVTMRRRRWVLAPLAAAAAMALFVFSPRDSSKGGELSMQIVREHAGVITMDPTQFAPGDRFKVRATCTESSAKLRVEQAGESFSPLPALERCGTLVPFAGSFTLSGDAPATLCVDADKDSVCRTLTLAPH